MVPRTRAPARSLPAKIPLALAVLVDRAPSGEAFGHEIKLDGYRMLARVEQGRVTLITRGGKDWTARAPAVAEALAALPDGCALDGELVCLDAHGKSDFQALQNAFRTGHARRLVLYAFDLLFDGFTDLRALPLSERKERLGALLARAGSPRIRLLEHIVGQGPEVFAQARALSLEGIVSKRLDAPYSGRRGGEWLKIKVTARQELVVVGYTPPKGSRKHLGALLVAVHEVGGGLRSVGKVGTGFDGAELATLMKKLTVHTRSDSPISAGPEPEERGVRWVDPVLVAEVSFTEVTADGLLRHPVYHGLREDKPAQAVVAERSVPLAAATGRGAKGSPKAHPRARRSTAKTHALETPE
jgi:bifunctional non-homologous end joining protein LigD